ncbi:MAG: hypothetical protein K2N56_12000 [Oscillospiraceae bacterium]|nr:hypothetical protein [Oscillospiraceae bacterium]
MKKIFSIILCAAVMLIAGCSGVSQEEYNSLVEENGKLKSETDQLKEELENLKASKADADDCFEIYEKILGLPKAAISEELPNQISRGLYEEHIFYRENDELAAKTILSFDSSLSAQDIAPYIKVYVDGVKDTADQTLQQYPMTANVFIYRYSNGNVIMSQCWYKEDDGTIKAPMFFTSYGEDVAEELIRLYKEEENSTQ